MRRSRQRQQFRRVGVAEAEDELSLLLKRLVLAQLPVEQQRVRGAHHHQPFEAVRVVQREGPFDGSAPVMGNEEELFEPKLVYEFVSVFERQPEP